MIHPYYKSPFALRLARSGELASMIAYLVSGALTSLADYSLFYLVLQLWGDSLLAATAIAYIGGLLVSYLLNRFWVFKYNAKGERFGTSIWRYGLLLLLNFGITYAMLWAMEYYFGISPFIGKFIVWTFMIFWNYIVGKLWVFKGPRQVRERLFR